MKKVEVEVECKASKFHPHSLIGHLQSNRPNPWMQAVAMFSSDEKFFSLNENSSASENRQQDKPGIFRLQIHSTLN